MNEYPLPDPHGLEDDQFGEARTSGQTTEWSDPYGMELLPADGMSLQQSMDAMDSKMPQFGDFTMVTLENIKPEPDWEQGFTTVSSSSIPCFSSFPLWLVPVSLTADVRVHANRRQYQIRQQNQPKHHNLMRQ